ncbi:MAG TPA: UDP-N-acetylmuramate dehydrogenase [Candidatus Binatus sp.]|nr:UDP-N-acetylmuramate dehydrogenase [Candidatus Binatus sp.]
MLSDAQRTALRNIGGKTVEFDVPLAPKTSMKVGGPAGAYAEIGGIVNLAALLSVCQQLSIPWAIIGFGSNLLVRDEGFDGLVVRLIGDFTKVTIKGTNVRAGGATPIVSLCREAALAGLSGAEALVGIPGTVGGAVRMNAGTDVEIGDIIKRVEVLIAGEPLQTFTTPEFSYRESSLDRRAVVTAAELELASGDPATLQAELKKRIAQRNATQPLEMPNSGSVFRNPKGDHAGRLIEAAGCKGWTAGGAQISEKHANFIVNRGGATCADVLELAARVREAVKEKSGVELELEVHVLS